MNDPMITLQGWVGSEPVERQAGPATVASFRLGATPRRFNRSSGEWVDDGATQWFTVNAWRQLGHNVKTSLRKGDPVVVHGRLVARAWLNQGVETSSFEIEAAVIGHDLTKGCSMLQRNPRPSHLEPAAPQDPWADELARADELAPGDDLAPADGAAPAGAPAETHRPAASPEQAPSADVARAGDADAA